MDESISPTGCGCDECQMDRYDSAMAALREAQRLAFIGEPEPCDCDSCAFDRMVGDMPEDEDDFTVKYVPAGPEFLSALHEAGTTYALALTALLNAQNGMAGALIIDVARDIFNLASRKYRAVLDRLDG